MLIVVNFCLLFSHGHATTNLGGWLMQEGWMTPLGSGEKQII